MSHRKWNNMPNGSHRQVWPIRPVIPFPVRYYVSSLCTCMRTSALRLIVYLYLTWRRGLFSVFSTSPILRTKACPWGWIFTNRVSEEILRKMTRKPCFSRPLFTLESSQSCDYQNLEVIQFHVRHLHCIKWHYIFEKRSYGVSIYLKNDMLRSKIGYLYCKIKNRVWPRQKPGFVGSNSVGSYGFSCRRKTRGHALLRT